MNPAFEVEGLKLRRSGVARVIALVLGLACPLMSAGLYLLSTMDAGSTLGVKAAAFVTAEGWAGYLGLVGQILTVSLVLAGGILTAWTFGREFADGTVTSLFAAAVPRSRTAAAKLVTTQLLLALVSLAAVVVALVLGLVIRPGGPFDWAAVGKVLVAALLCALLTTPFGWVASARRGYLPAIGVLLGVVVVTQLVTAVGGGGWWPYAAPSLWLGMGGPEAAAQVHAVQLLIPLVVAGLGAYAVVRWWERAEVA